MEFINKQHEKKYKEIKKGMGFTDNRGDYASFAYILSSPLLSPKINIVLGDDYRFKGVDKVQELMPKLSNSERALIDLAVSLYRGNGGDTVLNTFKALDKENLEVALNSISIRFGM